jgi:hypothetical protein
MFKRRDSECRRENNTREHHLPTTNPHLSPF